MAAGCGNRQVCNVFKLMDISCANSNTQWQVISFTCSVKWNFEGWNSFACSSCCQVRQTFAVIKSNLLLTECAWYLNALWNSHIDECGWTSYPHNLNLNPKKTGGGGLKGPPLDISRDYSATRKVLAATLYDFFLSSFPHILTPNLWRPGVRFWSYVTFCTCTSDRKWLQNVILCTKSMQIEFFHIVHINMLIFTLNGWNEFVLALLCFKKCLPQISPKKTTKTKGKKLRNT